MSITGWMCALSAWIVSGQMENRMHGWLKWKNLHGKSRVLSFGNAFSRTIDGWLLFAKCSAWWGIVESMRYTTLTGGGPAHPPKHRHMMVCCARWNSPFSRCELLETSGKLVQGLSHHIVIRLMNGLCYREIIHVDTWKWHYLIGCTKIKDIITLHTRLLYPIEIATTWNYSFFFKSSACTNNGKETKRCVTSRVGQLLLLSSTTCRWIF